MRQNRTNGSNRSKYCVAFAKNYAGLKKNGSDLYHQLCCVVKNSCFASLTLEKISSLQLNDKKQDVCEDCTLYRVNICSLSSETVGWQVIATTQRQNNSFCPQQSSLVSIKSCWIRAPYVSKRI